MGCEAGRCNKTYIPHPVAYPKPPENFDDLLVKITFLKLNTPFYETWNVCNKGFHN